MEKTPCGIKKFRAQTSKMYYSQIDFQYSPDWTNSQYSMILNTKALLDYVLLLLTFAIISLL